MLKQIAPVRKLSSVKTHEQLGEISPIKGSEQRSSVAIEPFDKDYFDTSSIPSEKVNDMLANSYGDKRLMAARIGLFLFERREKNGELGRNEDPTKIHPQLVDDVDQRLWDLSEAHLIELDQEQHSYLEARELGRVATGSATIRAVGDTVDLRKAA